MFGRCWSLIDQSNAGFEVTQLIEKGQAQWEDLFEKSDFFTRYKHYLQISLESATEDELHIWFDTKLAVRGYEPANKAPLFRKGFVESRLRVLIQQLEQEGGLSCVRPYTDGFAVIFGVVYPHQA